METYSIQLRLRRTTTEHCFVSVPVTSEILDLQADGTGRVNAEKMFALAVEMASNATIKWHQEEVVIEPHPIQRPKEADE